MAALPVVARRVSSNPDAYVYLAESIQAWPDQPALARRIAAPAGPTSPGRDLTYGIVALHRARRPLTLRRLCEVSRARPAARGLGREPHDTTEERTMGADDKTENKIEELGGKAKEAVGNATGDEDLERQGERDQSKANLKQAGEKVKDAFKKLSGTTRRAHGGSGPRGRTRCRLSATGRLDGRAVVLRAVRDRRLRIRQIVKQFDKRTRTSPSQKVAAAVSTPDPRRRRHRRRRWSRRVDHGLPPGPVRRRRAAAGEDRRSRARRSAATG